MNPKPDPFRIEGGVVEGTFSGVAQSVVNTGYLTFFLGVPLTMLVYFWYYLHGATAEVAALPYFKSVVVIYGVASMVELLSEPMFGLAQYRSDFRLRAICESAGVAAKCVVTFLLTVFAREDTGVLAFSLGQLAYSLLLTGLYLIIVWESTRGKENSIFLKKIWREEITQSPWFYFHGPTVRLASTLWLQTVFKHYLTEGDKILATYFSTISEQGIYALAVNYGSLIARLVFFPAEEAMRSLFAKLLAPPLTRKNVKTASDVFTAVLRVYTLVGILSCIFGPAVAPFFLSFVAGSQWSSSKSSAPSVLSAYAYYIPLLAFNGALEAHVQSIATPALVREQSILMVGFSIVFAVVGYTFMRVLKFGATGLVYANMVNLMIRILACTVWLRRYYNTSPAAVDNTIDEKRAASGRASSNESIYPLARRDAYPSITVASASALVFVSVTFMAAVDSWAKFLILAVHGAVLVALMVWEEKALAYKAFTVFMPARAARARSNSIKKKE
ncbi:Rft protein-domain-containing protein [Limtongia smithiae]|uniref:Rft protein-domain-containing protein n=1 Tax=Limtongia smithiae TaxID=1125753 RepID=UPI0034CD4FC8